MADFDQFAADPNAALARILARHPQDQLAHVLLQPWPADTLPPAERCPFPAHQIAVPAQHGRRFDQAAQRRTRDQTVEHSDDHPIGSGQLRPLDLPAQDPKLVAE